MFSGRSGSGPDPSEVSWFALMERVTSVGIAVARNPRLSEVSWLSVTFIERRLESPDKRFDGSDVMKLDRTFMSWRFVSPLNRPAGSVVRLFRKRLIVVNLVSGANASSCMVEM